MPNEEDSYDEDRFKSSLSWMGIPAGRGSHVGLIKHWVLAT